MYMDMERKVKDANKRFYDTIFDIYEKADGRRKESLNLWLKSNLEKLSRATKGGALLDLGCGSGFVLRNSGDFFKYSYGVDISHKILQIIGTKGLICADNSFIPFKSGSMDVVVCFAVLHHTYNYKQVFKEIYRVLKNGGILYTDHDIDVAFVRRFYPFIRTYRCFFNPANKYISVNKELTRDLYDLCEIHSNGIDSAGIIEELKEIGFSDIKGGYHWFGLNKITDAILGHRNFASGFAPLFTVLARK